MHLTNVFIQLKGDCKGTYVTNETKDGFDVVELQNGMSNVKFSYMLLFKIRNGIKTKIMVEVFILLQMMSKYFVFRRSINQKLELHMKSRKAIKCSKE